MCSPPCSKFANLIFLHLLSAVAALCHAAATLRTSRYMWLSRLRSYLMSMSLLHPGTQSLFFNMLTCMSIDSKCFDKQAQQEYASGLAWEVYKARVPHNAHGVTLRQLQLDLRSYGMLFVSFAGWSNNYDYGPAKHKYNSQPLSVPGSTLIHRDDSIWLFANSWTEIQEMMPTYTPGCGDSDLSTIDNLSSRTGSIWQRWEHFGDTVAVCEHSNKGGAHESSSDCALWSSDADSQIMLAKQLLQTIGQQMGEGEQGKDELLQLAGEVSNIRNTLSTRQECVQSTIDVLICG